MRPNDPVVYRNMYYQPVNVRRMEEEDKNCSKVAVSKYLAPLCLNTEELHLNAKCELTKTLLDNLPVCGYCIILIICSAVDFAKIVDERRA